MRWPGVVGHAGVGAMRIARAAVQALYRNSFVDNAEHVRQLAR